MPGAAVRVPGGLGRDGVVVAVSALAVVDPGAAEPPAAAVGVRGADGAGVPAEVLSVPVNGGTATEDREPPAAGSVVEAVPDDGVDTVVVTVVETTAASPLEHPTTAGATARAAASSPTRQPVRRTAVTRA
ncbi:hypothetical protein [Nakamurella endophytica]|uniref:Uncharacterized protein n=1 Tax=Nakamurella endophytica TaxID=1748367 RepID=A0A917SSU7_9ACTN|nr:hypothetical protein [Nakamurella endophytica]GGL95799.1 hypothetical protein GCM10011594_14380 [Nakamurella endophytica]